MIFTSFVDGVTERGQLKVDIFGESLVDGRARSGRKLFMGPVPIRHCLRRRGFGATITHCETHNLLLLQYLLFSTAA